MYIISKKKDFYDGVVGSMGIDKTLIYERTDDDSKIVKEFSFDNKSYSFTQNNPFLRIGHTVVKPDHKKYFNSSLFIIGFCGKLYLGWKFFYKVKSYNNYIEETKTDIIYGYDNAKKHLKTDGYSSSNIIDDINYVLNYDSIDIFRKINAPVFIYNDVRRGQGVLTTNPILKDWEFYRIVDSFSAFQEISMFLGGVLGTNEKSVIEIEDKYRISQYGFNKWSFRREPNK